MTSKKTMLAMLLCATATIATACYSSPITPKPYGDKSEAAPTAAILPVATKTIAPAALPTPTMAPEATSFEEDCMAICHIPDPNDYFGAGAKLLPANHAGRSTCLNCHTGAGASILPSSHLGRLDESCRGCHKEK